MTIGLSFILPGNVYSIAIDAVSMIGAGPAGPIIIKVFAQRHSAGSLLTSFFAGLLAAISWKVSGLGATFNESGIGLVTSLIVNFAYMQLRPNLSTVEGKREA